MKLLGSSNRTTGAVKKNSLKNGANGVQGNFQGSQVNEEEEEILAALVEEVSKATVKAKSALEQGLKDAENVLSEIRSVQ
ncbi:hypothetical protein [Desulfogranum mediterraneum]|uniref:hypothetical protein n=1 Tax=Desulfogranum mediterraneum TaxID=160661 RepID=UPI00041D395F|nr:hypothetical protein [Desulfogranum mediterraneum]